MSLTSSTQVQDSIIQAVGMIVDSKTSDLGYDKTIQGQINICVNESLGHYRVRYQDSLIDAYAADTSIKYLKGTSVYVQVPKGDMSQRKTILGAASQTGTQPIQEMIQRNEISDTSGNLLTVVNSKSWPKGVCSNKKDENNIQKDSVTIINDFNIKNSQIEGYLSNSTHFKISMLVKTNIPYEQRKDGEYGIRITASVVNNATGDKEDKVFQFNNYNFEGAPYSYDDWSKQSLIQDINGIEIKEIKDIEIYAENFPIINNGKIDKNIFFKQITLTGGTLLQSSEKNGVNLKFNAPQGYTISKGQTRPIQVQITSRMQKIDPKKQGLNIYWFVRDLNMVPGQPGYLNQGGIGWKRVYLGAKDTIKIKEGDIPSLQRECKYKCVVEYNEKKYEKEFTITDLNHNYVLSITSSEGTYFQYSHGCPTLTCTITDTTEKEKIDYADYNFVWYMNNNLNQTNYLKDVSIETQDEVGYQTLIDGTSKIWNNNETLNKYQKALNKLKSKEYFYRNKFYHVNLSKRVIDHSIFVCQVSNKKTKKNLGTISIEIKNKNATSNGYSLVINNGNQSFLYNQSGTALYGDTLENPYEIKPLSFSLFYKGREIDRTQLNQYKYEWKIPASNTLINYSTTSTAKNGYYSIGNVPTINFNVIKPYNVNNSNNDIVLTLNYRDMVLKASTVFSFAKQGGNGTNGTFYQLKVAKVKEDNKKYVIDNLNEPVFNFYTDKVVPSSYQFQVFAQKGGGTASGVKFTSWKILTDLNGTSSSLSNQINFNDKNNLGIATVYPNTVNKKFNSGTIYHNIIQVKGTLDSKTQYVSLCIPTIYYNNTQNANEYVIRIKKGSGFREVIYNNEGVLPSYDQRIPFEIEVFEKKDSTYLYNIANQFTYEWNVMEGSSLSRRGEGKGKSCNFTPTGTYFEKNCTSNAVYVTVKKGSALIATVHIPIHFMINRYSNPMLNDWDGTSIEIDDDKGYILSPQIGAGHKANEENDNSFTGIIMGAQQVKQNGKSKIRTGLFGYSSGARSIFLDANTGNATFGTSGAAQIKITATGDSTIQSGDYSKATKKGMKIKFSSTNIDDGEQGPYIKFGSGYFSVDSDGSIHAKGGGDIAGWKIKDDALYFHNDNYKTGMKSTSDPAFYAGTNTQNSYDASNQNAYNFYVKHNGYLFSKSGQIAGWNIEKDRFYKSNVGMAPDNWEHDEKNKLYTGVFWAGSSSSENPIEREINNKKIKFSKRNFFVTKQGYLFSKSGNIGGWSIEPNRLVYETYEGEHLKTSTGMTGYYTDSTKDAFWSKTYEYNSEKKKNEPVSQFIVDHEGNLTANSGKIGNWYIGDDGLYKVPKKIISKDTKKEKTKNFKYKDFVNNKNEDGIEECFYIGSDGISLGAYFHVDTNGYLYANKGNIGGCTISSSGIKGSSDGNDASWSINGNGTAKFTNVEINGASVTAMMTASSKGGLSGGGAQLGGGGFSAPGISTNTDGSTLAKGCTIKASQVQVNKDETLQDYINKLAKTIVTDTLYAKDADIGTIWVGDLQIGGEKRSLGVFMSDVDTLATDIYNLQEAVKKLQQNGGGTNP